MRHNPFLYEINTWVWLDTLSRRYGRRITLGDVPDEVLDSIARHKFDVVWLMGVWHRSPTAREIGLMHEGLKAEYNRALPGYTPDLVPGSPYAVYRYEVDPNLGGREGLAHLREALRARGIRLMLDYVPNHVAVDHHWTHEFPDALVQGTEHDFKARKGDFYRRNGNIFAHGRDPYFPPWGDTVQIDAFSPVARTVTRSTLLDIASQCDGVRCDMAMLLVSRIFSQTWRRDTNGHGDMEFWRDVIPAVKAQHPEFLFMAEVYWDMEHELQQLGFDYTYDKRLYDRMLHEPARQIRDHLTAHLAYQQRMTRFIENHDEPRAAAHFHQRIVPAAALALTLPGMKLLYEGQLEGRRVKLPVQLGRAPDEPPIEWLRAYYEALLEEVTQPPYHEGTFVMLAMYALPNESEAAVSNAMVAYAWAHHEDWRIVLINMAEYAVRGRVLLACPMLRNAPRWRFTNVLNREDVVEAPGEDILVTGAILEVPAHSAKIYRLERA